ncbi:MAG TPA: STAS/SEC14 domain-containing protein [Rhodocyclaceae bacterium]|jgi:hypothetical protein|nr:STAS/SEC14 domain-containing protein [Rhodocyclaceae bacterium]
MIAIDHKGTHINVTVLGEFTLADYREFEELVNYKVNFEGPIDLYIDLREMLDFTVDVMWEDIKFMRSHAGDFRRIAIVTNSQWIAWSAWLNNAFMKAELRVYDNEAEANAWLGAA